MSYKINKGFITQGLGDKTVIFDGEESILYTFNETATFMFNKIKLGWEKDKIIEMVVKKYKIGETEAQKDTKNLIRDLLAKKIIS